MSHGQGDHGTTPDEPTADTDAQRCDFVVGGRRRHHPHLDARPAVARARRPPTPARLWKSEPMAADGTEPDSDDLWADTRPDGTATPSGSPPPTRPPDGPDPTLVQPIVTGPPSGGPPPGGPPPPGAGPPGGGGDEPEGPPPWLLPAAAAMIGLLVIGLVVALIVRDGGEDDTAVTTLPLIGSVESSTTVPAATTSSSAIPPTTTTPTTSTTTTTQPTTTPATTTPATTPPTTTPPDPTTTAPPSPTTSTAPPVLPDPGLAIVDGITVEIVVSCLVVPLEPNTADLQVVSHLMVTDEGRLVLDRWFDEGGVDGLDGEFVDTASVLEAVAVDADGLAFTATLRPLDGGDDVEVAVNPQRTADCPDTIRTRDADDSELSQYTYAILDVCTVRPGNDRLDVAGIGSEGARFAVDDNGDGTAELRFTDRRVGDLVDPAATVSFDESVATYAGLVTDGDDARTVRIELELAAPRTCEPSEAP